MATMRRRLARRRTDLRWVFLMIGFFAFLFSLTWERMALKEASGQIERLEVQLQALETDEAFYRTQLKQECRFTEVQQIASREWGMSVAVPGQRVRLAAGPKRAAFETAALVSPPSSVVERVARVFKGGVAQAHSAADEEGNGTRAR
jgi:hypothetical protein